MDVDDDDDATFPPSIISYSNFVTYIREIITFIIHIFDTFKLDQNLAEHKQLIVNYRVLMSNYCYGSVFVIKIIASSHGLKGLMSL